MLEISSYVKKKKNGEDWEKLPLRILWRRNFCASPEHFLYSLPSPWQRKKSKILSVMACGMRCLIFVWCSVLQFYTPSQEPEKKKFLEHYKIHKNFVAEKNGWVFFFVLFSCIFYFVLSGWKEWNRKYVLCVSLNKKRRRTTTSYNKTSRIAQKMFMISLQGKAATTKRAEKLHKKLY